jgi:hypothetical protein
VAHDARADARPRKDRIVNLKLRALLLFLVALATACQGVPGQTEKPTPANADGAGLSDSAPVVHHSDTDGPLHITTGPLLLHAPSTWKPRLVIAKCQGDLGPNDVCSNPYEVVETEGNAVTTAGANQLWTGLSSTVALPWNTTNTQLAVGDSTTAFAAGQTDMQAALATKINAADVSSCTNATPIVCAGTYSPTPVVGEVYAFSGFSGAGAAAINNTFELSAASASSITLLNSAGSGAITVTGGIIQKVNKYRQIANAAGSAVVTTNQIVYVATVPTANANGWTWNEWGMTTGAAATNKQAAPPPTLLNRAVVNLGQKTSASSWTATLTLQLT